MHDWTRRKLLAAFGTLSIALVMPLQKALAADTNDAIPFRWEVPEAHRKTVEDELTYEGNIKKAEETKGVVVWVFVGLALLPSLIQSVIALQRQIQYGGIVIDTRKQPLDIRVDKRLPSGLIVVVQPDGKTEFERDDVMPPDGMITSIIKGLGGK